MALSGIPLSAALVCGSAIPLDGKYGPFTSVADANSNVTTTLRHKGLTLGILENGSVVEYWYKDNITDAGLVKKTDYSNITLDCGTY